MTLTKNPRKRKEKVFIYRYALFKCPGTYLIFKQPDHLTKHLHDGRYGKVINNCKGIFPKLNFYFVYARITPQVQLKFRIIYTILLNSIVLLNSYGSTFLLR